LDDESLAAQALQEGAQDYLINGQIETRGLLLALRHSVERKIMDDALFGEKERAQVTLNSIGDAVVRTEFAGNITFLNLAEGSAAPVPLCDLLADALRGWNQNTPYAESDDWVFPSLMLKGKMPQSASIMAAAKIRPAALQVGIRLEPGQRFGFHNFRHSLAMFLVSKGKDVMTIQGLLRHAKGTTTLDLYFQSIDAAKLEAQEDVALAITSTAAAE
jgi:integrase